MESLTTHDISGEGQTVVHHEVARIKRIIIKNKKDMLK
jgi:hypothetical protein